MIISSHEKDFLFSAGLTPCCAGFVSIQKEIILWIKKKNLYQILNLPVGMAACSLYLDPRYDFVKKISGAVVAIVGGMVASNTGIFPSESSSYDIVWNYIVPLVIPLLLMKTDVRKVFKVTGRMAGAFQLSALGTLVGSVVAVALLHSVIYDLKLIGPAMTGSYIGGGVNFVAIVSMFH